jgi:hypothetical protein
MNTIMEEKIKQAFQEWKETDKPKETIMKKQTTHKLLTHALLDKITAEPGITGKDLRAYVAKEFPTTPVSYVPSILKGFYDTGMVSRVEANSNGNTGRATYAYTFVPASQRKPRPKRKAHTKASKGISALVPVVTPPLAVGPTTLHITISTSLGAYSMKLDEAKFIYSQLHQIFGGVR